MQLVSRIKKKTSCIDLWMTNFRPSFMRTNVFETDISDLYKIISSIMKFYFTRESPRLPRLQ